MIADAGGDVPNSALFAAIVSDSVAMVAWMLENGADDLTITNFQDKTPLQVAEALGHEDIITLLKVR